MGTEHVTDSDRSPVWSCNKCVFVSGLAGKTELDQAKVDMVVDCLEDFFRPTMGICGAPKERKVSYIGHVIVSVTSAVYTS